MLKPEFPYLDNQLILSSNRIVLHSKTDAIFLFGRGAVSLSSPQTINLDSSEKVLIDAPKIELGNKAESEGQPVVLGYELNIQLQSILDVLVQSSVLLGQVSESDIGASMQYISAAGQLINLEASRILNLLTQPPQNNPIFSKNTFTR